MSCPLMAVTGPIAGGKTTVARILAASGGAHIDADAIAKRAFEHAGVRSSLRREFGSEAFREDGKVSAPGLGRIAFGGDPAMSRLNSIMKPVVTALMEEEVEKQAERFRYIVLDAVLFFEYKFRFNAGLVVLVTAPAEVRLRRLIERDGLSEAEARGRIERQGYLEKGWKGADITIDTSGDLEGVLETASLVRDRFIREQVI